MAVSPTNLANAERIAKLENEISHVNKTLCELRALMLTQAEATKNIQSELATRRDFGQGMRAGIALMWMLLGGLILSVVNQFFNINLGIN